DGLVAKSLFASASLAGDVRTEGVAFSHAALEAAQADMNKALRSFLGRHLVLTALDPIRNAVVVGVSERIDGEALSEIKRIVGNPRVGVELETLPESSFEAETMGCEFPYCSRPLRGGQVIYQTYGLDACTAGFRANGLDGKKYILTAGHCRKD